MSLCIFRQNLACDAMDQYWASVFRENKPNAMLLFRKVSSSFQTKKGRGVGGNFMDKCVKLKTRRTQFDLNQTEKICDSIKIQFYL